MLVRQQVIIGGDEPACAESASIDQQTCHGTTAIILRGMRRLITDGVIFVVDSADRFDHGVEGYRAGHARRSLCDNVGD